MAMVKDDEVEILYIDDALTPGSPPGSVAAAVPIIEAVLGPAPGAAAVTDDLPRRYLALIAGVADELLAADDPAVMVDRLFALIRSELKLDVFFNYRFDEQADRLVLETHGGLTPEEAAYCAELVLGQAVCGCVARDRLPAHVTAIQQSDDSRVALVRNIGVDTYACTPLVHGSRLLGTLSFGRRWTSSFTPDELNFLHTICHYVALAKHRLRIEEDLRGAIESRENVLAELNHRVRNSLQLAVGLIALDTGSVSVEAERALRRAMDRIQVLAAAHRPLYGALLADRADLGEMLHGVFEQAMPVDTARHYQVPVDQAVIVALLIHELTILHPPAETGLTLALDRLGAELQIRLDGLTPGDAPQNTRLVDALARQLRATLAIAPSHAILRLPYGDA